jgi:hypothetical protein
MSASAASFLAVLLSFGLAACAPTTRQPSVSDQVIEQEAAFQREMAFSEEIELKNRLSEVGMNIAIGAAPLCGRWVTNTLGMDYVHYTAAKPEFRLAARRVLQSDEYPVISSVAVGGPAARARISVADKLVRIDDWMVPKAGNVMKAVDEKMQEIAAEGGEHQIGVLRGTSRLSFKVAAVLRCDSGIALTEDDQVNAFANGSTILVTTGMMRFLKNDDELALILGHEMAHNILAHQAKQQGNMLLGALLGFARSAIMGVNVVGTQAQAGTDAYSRAFEAGYSALAVATLGQPLTHELAARRERQRHNGDASKY